MTSHKFDRGRRLRQEEVTGPPQNVLSSRIPGVPNSNQYVSTATRSQVSGPSLPSRNRRGSSVSEGEEANRTRIPTPHRTKISSKENDRSIGIPQPSKTGSALAPSPILLMSKMASPAHLQSKPDCAVSARAGKSSAEGRSRNVLRRKAPSIEQYTGRSRAKSNPSKSGAFGPNTSLSNMEDSKAFNLEPRSLGEPQKSISQGQAQQAPPLSVPLPSTIQLQSRTGETYVTHIPKEITGPTRAVNTTNLPPPTPNFASTSSPSTRYSESPGPWSSRTSTPTSMSSYSPGITQPTKVGSRLRQPSPSMSRSPLPRQSTAPVPAAVTINKDAMAFYPRTPRKSQTHPPLASTKAEKPERHYVVEKQKKFDVPSDVHLPLKSSIKFNSAKSKEDDVTPKPSAYSNKQEEKQNIEPCQSKFEKASRVPLPASTLPPSRPSRAGTSGLELKPSPVIQSNITNLKHLGHKRQASSDHTYRKHNPTHHINSSTESLQSKVSTPITNRYVSHYSASGQKLSTKDSLSHTKVVAKDSKKPKESASTSGTRRFGIFSRKAKTDPEVNAPDGKDKPSRRGPAAGTGHEGYGRYAQRGRRSSISSVNGRARSLSTAVSTRKGSNASRTESEMDDFLLDRLEPVIISGGGVDGEELRRTQSEQSASGVSVASTIYSQPSVQFSKPVGDSSESLASHETFDPLLQRLNPKEKKPGLVNCRSFGKPLAFGAKKDTTAQLSVNTDVLTSRPSIDSCNTSQTSFSQTSVSIAMNDRVQDKTDVKKPDKRGRWNFFQRSHHTSRKGSTPQPSSSAEVPVAISKLPSRQIAHYALLEDEYIDSESLKEIFQRIEESPPTEEDDQTEEVPLGLGLKQPHGHSVLLPSPPLLGGYTFEKPQSSPPKVFFNKNIFGDKPKTDAQPRSDDVRQQQQQRQRSNRLAPVGRIPQVVSSREEQATSPIPSFSRPFSRIEIPSLTSTANSQPTLFYNPGRPPTGSQTEVLPSEEFYPGSAILYPSAQVLSGSNSSYNRKDREFLAFPRRKSVTSGSSSSEGRVSLTAIAAVEPRPYSKLNEDEIWNEYDEFIDTVLSPKSPHKARRSTPSQKSFKMATRASKTLQEELNGLSNTNYLLASPSEYSNLHRSMSSARSSGSLVHLRRSMILSALHSSMTPSTTVSFIDPYGRYNNKNSAELVNQGDLLHVRQAGSESDTIRESSFSTPRNNEAGRRKNTMLLDIAERDRNGTIAQTNLRSGSLMTSRWLSFGRVLFSPAHNHLQEQDQDRGRVLVIDGLGNDDWSFYCALTYPSATVYSLGFLEPSASSNNPAAWKPPANHRTIHHDDMENPFPFPKSFFIAAVIRFPAACSDAGLRATISECKRVLRPGAYLEMNIMDLDMVNMGTRTRKAVRMLKERICMADPSISLKPASDNIQRLLGKRGFENLNRCMVGVPVAGTLLSSSDTSSSSRSTIATLPTPTNPYGLNSASTTKGNRRSRRPPSDDPGVSLGDLLSDSNPSESNDESIAKMVAKVARWWYTRCYEAFILPDGNPDYSIWADRRVLRECQRRGTGFRLLIAYAQNPSGPRRTASV
ncbi:hypothetical protein PABG_06294 [Paracoccidioides brasiliensis Pb03]|nr:hypothetical protein PABG_06294 [Paracoccidioides brasiliensis Pb03]